MPRGLMKRTLSFRPLTPTQIGTWSSSSADPAAPNRSVSGVKPLSDGERATRMLEGLRVYAAAPRQEQARAEMYDVAQRRRPAMAVAARHSKTSRLVIARPLVFTVVVVTTWLRRRGNRRRLMQATNQLCIAPDQILEDLGVSRDQMLAKSMCRPCEDEELDETEPDQ